MQIRVEGYDLPGRRDGTAREGTARDVTVRVPAVRVGLPWHRVQVGVQRRAEVLDRVPADADRAVWDVEATSREVDGLLDVGGPFVHGRPGARFLYLCWGVDERPGFAVFSRAKLMFGDIATDQLRAAHDAGDGARLLARLALTDADGAPRCARVRPPDITWQLITG